jgi:two-component system, NarL family, response regulator DevR
MPISANRTRVLLVDEEVVVRAGLRLLIDSWPTLQVIGEADTPSDALAAMAEVKPNLIVCSYVEAKDPFLADLRVVVERAAKIPVVVLASSRHPNARVTALETGVNCVISKKRTAVELRQVLEQLGIRRNGASKSKAAIQSNFGGEADSERPVKART